jgi:hypothetical protein
VRRDDVSVCQFLLGAWRDIPVSKAVKHIGHFTSPKNILLR